MRVDPQWNELIDGRAKRLDTTTTVATTPIGHLAGRDPLETTEGWRSGWRWVVTVGWTIAIAMAATLGWFRGKGPLGPLHSYKEDPPTFGKQPQPSDVVAPEDPDR